MENQVGKINPHNVIENNINSHPSKNAQDVTNSIKSNTQIRSSTNMNENKTTSKGQGN